MTSVFSEQLQSVADRLGDPDQLDTCADELRQMRKEKWLSLGACDGSCSIEPNSDVSLVSDVEIIERALTAIEQKDAAGAASLLRGYLSDAG